MVNHCINRSSSKTLKLQCNFCMPFFKYNGCGHWPSRTHGLQAENTSRSQIRMVKQPIDRSSSSALKLPRSRVGLKDVVFYSVTLHKRLACMLALDMSQRTYSTPPDHMLVCHWCGIQSDYQYVLFEISDLLKNPWRLTRANIWTGGVLYGGTAHKYHIATESTGVYENLNPHNSFESWHKSA